MTTRRPTAALLSGCRWCPAGPTAARSNQCGIVTGRRDRGGARLGRRRPSETAGRRPDRRRAGVPRGHRPPDGGELGGVGPGARGCPRRRARRVRPDRAGVHRDRHPGWTVNYVDEAVLDGSGEVVELAVTRPGHYASGTTYPPSGSTAARGSSSPTSGGDVVDVYVAGTFEGYTQVLAGIAGDRAPFRASRSPTPRDWWSTSPTGGRTPGSRGHFPAPGAEKRPPS